jgi:RNA polymerase sigma-70 factor (ECF subfamily)
MPDVFTEKAFFYYKPEQEAEEIPLQEEALNNLSLSEIFNLIVELPIGYRTVFNLYAIEGMGHKEIARLLGHCRGYIKITSSIKPNYCCKKNLVQKGRRVCKTKLEITGNNA